MSKRYSKDYNTDSPAKKFKLDITKEQNVPRGRKSLQNGSQTTKVGQNIMDDLWGDDFGEEEIEEMDFIASQATQEESVFATPRPIISKTSKSPDSEPSTSSGLRGGVQQNHVYKSKHFEAIIQSQIMGSSEINKEIIASTQAIMFDDFESEVKGGSLNSTFRNRPDAPSNNVVLVTDDDQVEKWQEEKKKLLEDFLTKEGETEFLRQQLNQIQARAENAKKEQNRLMEEQSEKYRQEINALKREKTALESQLQLQKLEATNLSEKNKLRESGSIKFAQPQTSVVRPNKDRSNMSVNWSMSSSSSSSSSKKVKTKESSVQVESVRSVEHLKTSIISFPLRTIPQCIFEPPEPEKSVVEIKIEEKIGKRNLAIIQEEETFRIFENPELSKPKVTIIDGKNLSTEFFLPDLAKLMNKTSEEINSIDSIPTINKLYATTRELLLNSTLVLQKISQALQNDDIRDMNELYLSEFYEMPVLYTKSYSQAQAWYDLERGVETRRAVSVLLHVVLASKYLADVIAGNVNLNTNNDLDYESYTKQMKSYEGWHKKGSDFEFLNLVLEFVTIVGVIRRSHQFTGLINAILTLITNVQSNVGFSVVGLKKICAIVREVIYSRPLLACFIPISHVLKEFSNHNSFVGTLCISPDKSGINYWKGSLSFAQDACPLEIFITQLDHFKLDPITLINITKDLAKFSNRSLLKNSIPWLEKTVNSCNCCLNLLKFVVVNLYECSKIDINELRNKYTESNISWRASKHEVGKKNMITWKDELCEDWLTFEKNRKENFWNALKKTQSSAIAYGIRLLSFLAKKDLDFMIRLSYIEDAFHLFLDNLNIRDDLKLKTSDEIALDIVKKTFVLEKNKEENKSNQQKLEIISLENESWTDFTPAASPDLIKLYEDYCLE